MFCVESDAKQEQGREVCPIVPCFREFEKKGRRNSADIWFFAIDSANRFCEMPSLRPKEKSLGLPLKALTSLDLMQETRDIKNAVLRERCCKLEDLMGSYGKPFEVVEN